VVYTPEREHFGIVPLEAMALECPVIACKSGGPVETVRHKHTGYLTDGTVLGFANAMVLLLARKEAERIEMAAAARAHVAERFARPAFARAWQAVLAGQPVLQTDKKSS
jgi:alpha-1,3/alpha-1,6-mannosyltransferase